MKRFRLLMVSVLLFVSCATYPFSLGRLPANQVGLGYGVVHLNLLIRREPLGSLYYPGFSLTTHGYYAGAFQNTFHRLTIDAGIDRVILSSVHYWRFDLGYKLGLFFGGYCFFDLYCEQHPNVPIMPAFQVYGDIGLKDNFLEFSWLGAVTTVAFKHVF